MDIRGKNAIVTGASSGIGLATAVMLAERGAATVVLADIDAEGLKAATEQVRAAGAKPIVKVVDVSRADDVIRLFEEAERETGGVDIVHNNAGIMTGEPDFPDTVMSKMILVMQINLLAMMIGTRAAIGHLRKRGAPGVIINTSSVAAFGAMPADPAYSTSKAGVVNFTQSCKPLHERFNIRVMAICPGITDTKIVPRDAPWLEPMLQKVKMLQPRDIAQTVCEIIVDDTQAGDFVVVQNQEVVPA